MLDGRSSFPTLNFSGSGESFGYSTQFLPSMTSTFVRFVCHSGYLLLSSTTCQTFSAGALISTSFTNERSAGIRKPAIRNAAKSSATKPTKSNKIVFIILKRNVFFCYQRKLLIPIQNNKPPDENRPNKPKDDCTIFLRIKTAGKSINILCLGQFSHAIINRKNM